MTGTISEVERDERFLRFDFTEVLDETGFMEYECHNVSNREIAMAIVHMFQHMTPEEQFVVMKILERESVANARRTSVPSGKIGRLN